MGENLEWWHLSNPYIWWLEICQVMNWFLIFKLNFSLFFFFFCFALHMQLLLYLLNCSVLGSIFLLPLWFCPPSHWRAGREGLGKTGPPTRVKPQHNTTSQVLYSGNSVCQAPYSNGRCCDMIPWQLTGELVTLYENISGAKLTKFLWRTY